RRRGPGAPGTPDAPDAPDAPDGVTPFSPLCTVTERISACWLSGTTRADEGPMKVRQNDTIVNDRR
ncbi:MAG: hypothetical protein WAL12_12310, partial [Trebonia sp.]